MKQSHSEQQASSYQKNDTPDQSTRDLLKQLQRLGRQKRVAPGFLCSFFAAQILVALLEKSALLPQNSIIREVLFFGFMASIVAVIATMQMSHFGSSQRIFIISVLDEVDSVLDVGALVEALDVVNTNNSRTASSWSQSAFSSSKRDISDAVSDALKRLLRKMQPEDVNCLNTKQYDRLHKSLFPKFSLIGGKMIYDSSLALQVLRTLEVIGRQESLSYLHKLISAPDTEEQFRQQALISLAAIESRLLVQQTNETLLRPSTTVPTNQLLRAASGTGQITLEETAQLLRSTVGQDNAPNG